MKDHDWLECYEEIKDKSWRSLDYLDAVDSIEAALLACRPHVWGFSPRDVSWISEYGLEQKLSNAVRVF